MSDLELKAQYRVLSEMLEHFPRNSNHKVFKHINRKMDEILTLLELKEK